MSNYTPFLTIRVDHDYFTNATGSALLSLIPTNKSLEWLRQHHMFAKQSPDGLTIFCDPERIDDISPADEEYRLQFHITSADPYFRNYTQIDDLDIKSLALFNCQSSDINNPITEVAQWINSTKINNLNYIEPITERDIIKNLVGVINFLEPSSQFGNLKKAINLRFRNNSAIWQYFIPAYLADKNISIIDIKSNYSFHKKSEILLGKTRFMIFESDTKLPIHKRSELNLQLRSDQRILLRRLATASPEHMKWLDTEPQKTPLCHIYIQ
ncbi:hypothetical protein [Vibrio sp. 10N]|uniref:hypothetical protein n=1 Tax=Vibrio sp. 10N TaxID=3058938 RepID=UPI00281299A9|nr:hypothetical protein VB10N_36160 [Vibrio sp. 10N]